MSKIVEIFVFVTFATAVVFCEDKSHEHEQEAVHESNDHENVTISRCNELNQHRLELNKCCNYPHINLHRILIDSCLDECVASKDSCCPIGCLWRITKIVYDEKTVNLNGFKKTLKNSVYHDNDWEEIIEQSVDECAQEVKPTGLDSHCQYPEHLPRLIGCTIKKLFLQCPKMHSLPACEVTKQYVTECM
ncbi:hypothetical protein PVAND_014531 [Polypedilum vanderplanki]|uniref:Uncharacterized protein n=1 Tax=Polypedilum vanderplanki TaxID=319348 RepID=A0A9J6BAG2_POLVA|nr:hypothetical protein PVAND_014531 [Polypedilum vanderplanki]